MPVRSTAGPVLEKPGDLAAILTNLKAREVLFIDEIHGMSPAIEEILYPALEDYELDLVIGQGPGARSVKVPLQPFTLVGATTRTGLLTAPLRSRFGIVHRLDFYAQADMAEIVRRSARILGVPLDADAGAELSRRARGTPRIANRLLRRVRDYAQVRADGTITLAVARRPRWRMLEVDAHGFDEIDRRLLRTIIDKFGGGPVGLTTIAAAISEEPDAIEDIYEPFLMQLGFIDRTPRGRVATALRLPVLRAGRARKGQPPVVTRPPAAAAASRIDSLATFVPPRLLTNADLERMVETTDEWILQRTGIRERHIVDPGVATSDLAAEAAREAIAKAGLRPDRDRPDRRRHHHPRHDLPEHGLPGAAQDRRHPGLGLRPRRRLLRLHLLARHRGAVHRQRRARARAGDRRRRDVEHHRLHRSHHLRAVRRRRRRGGAGPGGRRSRARAASSTSPPRSTARAARRCACRPAAACKPASHETVDQRLHYVHQDGQTVFKFAVRKTEEICRRLLERNGLAPGDIDLLVSHQANRRIIQLASREARHRSGAGW